MSHCTSSPKPLRRGRQPCTSASSRDLLFHSPASIIHSAQRLFADLNLMPLGQLFGWRTSARNRASPAASESPSLVAESWLGSLRFEGRPRSPCTTTASPCLAHPLQQLPHPPVTHAHLLRGLPLRDAPCPAPVSTNPAHPVPLGSSRFVPSFSLTAVKRNFLLGQIGTSHFAATPLSILC